MKSALVIYFFLLALSEGNLKKRFQPEVWLLFKVLLVVVGIALAVAIAQALSEVHHD